MKWFIVALLATRMEAFEMGTGDEAYTRCRGTLAAFEKQETVVLPKRLVDMLELDVVVALTCIDGETVVGLMAGTWGKTPTTREDLDRPLPRLPSPPPAGVQGTPDVVFRMPQIGAEPEVQPHPFAKYKF